MCYSFLVQPLKYILFYNYSFGMWSASGHPQWSFELHQRHNERAPLQVLHRVRVQDRLRRRGQDRADVRRRREVERTSTAL